MKRFHSVFRNSGVSDIKRHQAFQSLQLCQTGVRDLRAVDVQLFQAFQIRERVDTFVGDGCTEQVQLAQLG